MIFSKNRYPLFRIMLKGIPDPVNGPCASASQAEAGVGSG
jgi:hypothetical protein